MATAGKAAKSKDIQYSWEGKDKGGKIVKGEMRSQGEASVSAHLRRQGITVTKVKKSSGGGGSVSEKDVTLFTRQLATMLKSGVPLLQAFDIVGKGHDNPAVSRLLLDIKTDVETGSSLQQAFKKFPLYFDDLFCNLVGAGEQAGILDTLLDRLATYKEKIQAIKGKIKSALMYPISIIVIAFSITAVIMIFVIPAFKKMFEGFGADLPAPTLIVMAMSDFFVEWWWAIFGIIGGGLYWFFYTWKRSKVLQRNMDIVMLKMPIFGALIRKATIARWTRTLSTMFAAGVPLVEAFDSVAGASGNAVYFDATKAIQREVMSGSSLTVAMQNTNVFPS
ncbi:MAG: type II secretion system F family protein, partial [Gallionellaceae bacterium]|nr:type II secretion system F family protein [Gallionellaceae bacterium]